MRGKDRPNYGSRYDTVMLYELLSYLYVLLGVVTQAALVLDTES